MRPLALLPLLPLFACGGKDVDSACNVVWFQDADGDGFGDEGSTSTACEVPEGFTDNADDCDDSDATVYPDAEERCDTRDNDCDGEVDEDGLSTLYSDADGDGYGDDATATEGCEDGGGGVLVGGDCDDGDAEVNPDAEEVCDGVDNDCSGVADDEAIDASTWYSDADGDGYGDASAPVQACNAPSGTVADDSDCDDSYGLQYPGAPEVCNDGRVNDCDGSEADARAVCVLESLIDLADADAVFNGDQRDDLAGASVAGGGDLDGDGDDDLLIGAVGQDEGGSNSGTVYYVLNPSGPTDLLDSATRLLGEAENDRAGSAVVSAGDALGDGFPAVAVGAIGESSAGASAGAVYLITGSASGAVSLADAETKWTGAAAGDQLGAALASADFNGDGVNDVLAGAPGAGSNDAGAAYILSGLSTSGSVSTAAFQVSGAAASDAMGSAVACGDLDGDGAPDALVGAALADPNGSQSGSVGLYYDPLGAVSITTLQGSSNGDYAGDALAVGDLDGDGFGDLIIGAPRVGNGDNGAAYVILGQAAQLSARVTVGAAADFTVTGDSRGDYAGSAVSVVPDVDGDGDDELLVGATGLNGEEGGAYLVLGGALSGTLSLANADSIMTGLSTDDQAGGAVAGVGDVDGDGAGDLLVGAVGVDTGGAEAGAAYLVLGPGI
ncbi:MAG: FG-GAP repeat protein [Alphaproteobacteria bacterium]|nr:FG-GAP repeat protein [Alphaproteobacteria bacterium]